MTRSYGNRARTDQNRLTDALLFCAGATEAAIAGKSADDICALFGVRKPANRLKVADAMFRRMG